MSDIKLFHLSGTSVWELKGQGVAIEKSLQDLIEKNMDALLGVRMLASEKVTTGKTHHGRIDSLGIDEDYSPVIVEYKRAQNENVINQGLFYLDWLLDHKAEFKLLVLEELGKEAADSIDWRNPRLLCIAGDFTHYDQYAVQQITRNIGLIRYRRFGDDLLMLELVNSTIAEADGVGSSTGKSADRTVTDAITAAPPAVRDRYEALKAYMLALGDDVVVKTLKYYFGFRRLKNFACVEIHPQAAKITVYLKVEPDSITLEEGFTRDVRNVGHFGTGQLEVVIDSEEDVERAKPLILQSYQAS